MPYFSRHEAFDLFYLDDGPRTGAPATVLLIAGLSCDMHDWSWQVPFLLSLNLRVISVDGRGQGKSSSPQPTTHGRPPPGSWPGPEGSADPAVVDYYPQSTAHDVMALLDHLGVKENLVVMSHSLGDCIGYYIATSRPKMVAASIGIDPIHAFTDEQRAEGDALFDNVDALLPSLIGYFGTFLYAPDGPAWQKTWQLRRMAQLDPKVAYAICYGGWGDAEDSLGRRGNSARAFGGKLKCPRLTMGSSEWYVATDREHMPKGSEELDEIVIIEDRGHWFHQLEGEAFNGHVERWLGRIGVLPAKGAE
ncbi:alpha/beta hydrolase fold [Colletotrichum sojae]|uniref:Alpha/beta hydrolase fold n=1 Tax=Colletotrichum sojae TaxID=2175907 RepID=A0A8H6JAR4_9PEZI|nr:alpha/beta hydrolase fold [Colletotrichum sojae]